MTARKSKESGIAAEAAHVAVTKAGARSRGEDSHHRGASASATGALVLLLVGELAMHMRLQKRSGLMDTAPQPSGAPPAHLLHVSDGWLTLVVDTGARQRAPTTTGDSSKTEGRIQQGEDQHGGGNKRDGSATGGRLPRSHAHRGSKRMGGRSYCPRLVANGSWK